MQQRPYKVVAISDFWLEADYRKLNQIVSMFYDDMIVVGYSNDADLTERIKRAYWSKKKLKAGNYLDNSFEIKLATHINLN